MAGHATAGPKAAALLAALCNLVAAIYRTALSSISCAYNVRTSRGPNYSLSLSLRAPFFSRQRIFGRVYIHIDQSLYRSHVLLEKSNRYTDIILSLSLTLAIIIYRATLLKDTEVVVVVVAAAKQQQEKVTGVWPISKAQLAHRWQSATVRARARARSGLRLRFGSCIPASSVLLILAVVRQP